MRAPAEFVVLRHLLSHSDDAPAQIAQETGLHIDTANKAMKRLEAQGFHEEEQRLNRLRQTARRPERRSLHFRAPNPLQWLKQFQGPYLVSGQVAAAEADHYNLVPATLLAYVPADRLEEAAKAALDVFAQVTSASEANLHLRAADPWLVHDDNHPHVVERGQRLLDYEDDPLIPLARRMTPPG